MKKEDPTKIELISKIDKVIHSPSRFMIMTILYTTQAVDFLFLSVQTKFSKGNLASHLKKLEEKKYIIIEKSFKGKIPRTTYKLSKHGHDQFQKYQDNLSRILTKIKEN